ncbi:MAG: PAS domain S-box protein [Acidobacteria bacterium]|nr:PAS domain S-box protein [Acidobacteriota bacterium]
MDVMDQRQWLSWLVRVRIVIISFLLGIQLIIQEVAEQQRLIIVQVPMKYFLAVLIFWYLLDLIFHILLKIRSDHRLQAYVQMLLDITMVSLVVYFTGGLDSHFYFLYPLTILMGSIILYRGGAYLVASLSFIQAGIVLELAYYDIIPSYGLTHPDLKSLQLRIAINLVAFMAVAYLAGKLAAILRQTGVQLRDKEGQLEDLQALNEDIIESMRGGLITTDLSGRILLLNSPGAEILGCSFASVAGRPIEDIFPQVAPGSRPDLSKPRSELSWHSSTGEEKFLGLGVAPLSRSGEIAGYVYNFQDVTQLKQLEREIQLQDRMAALGRMAAAIAHEIRNPLASIAGSVKLFSGMVNLTNDQQRLLSIVLKESERLNGIITDFLLYSREKTYKFEVANVGDILEETLTLLENHPQFGEIHRIDKTLPPEPLLASVDVDRLRQVFWNLGGNALKAMPAGGTLFVQMAASGGQLEIVFRDTGVGITPEQAGKMFEPFQSDFEGGTGLGLAIVYQIVQAHKGSIRAEAADQGCRFRMELPQAVPVAGKTVPTVAVHG